MRSCKLFAVGVVLVLVALAAGNSGQAQTPPPGMALIPAGNFQMGDSFNEGGSDERPVRTVFVSAFFMDQFEVTKTLWDEVAEWAAANGYDIGPGDGSGKAGSHPVINVSWYEAVKWANARSEKEGLMPCYYTDSGQTQMYRTGRVNVKSGWVKWNEDCYRLPTEAEWEKAARGGVEGHRYPWSDTDEFDSSRANCDASRGGTTPVGSFAPNGYGMFDMAGNVWEWVWDWKSPELPGGIDPRGPASGSFRVRRGGGWLSFAIDCRVASRVLYSPGNGSINLGFRLVRAVSSLP